MCTIFLSFSVPLTAISVLFVDLVNKYEEILPPAVLKKKSESDCEVPVRRRTRPVDIRMSRSRMSAGADLKELHDHHLQLHR